VPKLHSPFVDMMIREGEEISSVLLGNKKIVHLCQGTAEVCLVYFRLTVIFRQTAVALAPPMRSADGKYCHVSRSRKNCCDLSRKVGLDYFSGVFSFLKCQNSFHVKAVSFVF